MNYENLMNEKFDAVLEKEFESLLGGGYNPSKQGELIRGKVVAISKEHVVIDIGYKSEGLIPLNQFKDSDGKISVNMGDEIEVLMLAPESEDGEMILSHDRAQQLKTWNKIEEVHSVGTHIVGRVVQKVKGGLQVDVGVPAFLPGSQIDVRPQRSLDKFVGQDLEFKVLKFNRDRGNIVLSRRAVLEEERTALKKDTIDKISEGTVMEGTVKNVTHYGAFIDLGGIDGLLHITDMSWGRVNHPNEILNVGQVIPVVVLKYDENAERVSLGMKQLNENPWEKVQSTVHSGSTVKGEIVSLTDYGAFVKLEDGIEGLIHVSEMSWTKKIKHPSKVVSVGDTVEAVVLEVSAENQRISLGLKQLTPNPWEDLKREFPIGSRLVGTVRSVTDFGIFVNVKDDIDGLVHVSDFSWVKRIKDSKEIGELYKKGDKVEVVVLEIDPTNERLSLGIKQLEPDIWTTVPARYPNGVRVKGTITNVTDFGIFVELEEGVEGLIHISQVPLNKDENIASKYKVGEVIEAEVTTVDKLERRISLSLKPSKRKQKEEYSQYLEDESNTVVTFGDLLQQQLNKEEK
ncbi:MAG: 30S ribosomal protein S1 [Deltaproteobacteria bacterium]|jgi:small subunit ribosomal protein S1|nr:30S ribosomal protein S1 [Deltaproteobacteria bacterium]